MNRSVDPLDGDEPEPELDSLRAEVVRLQAEMERLRQFAFLAAHDLRSPLRATRTVISIVQEDYGDALPEAMSGLLATVDSRSAGLERLVEDLLVYSTESVGDETPEATGIPALIDEAVVTVDIGGHAVAVSAAIDRPVVVTRRSLIVCLRQLIDNACRHHDRSDGQVGINATVEGDRLVIEVVDDGPGIPEGLRAKVFEPLQTGDKTVTSGVGLARVKRLVDRSGASIELQTEPGAGSRFTMRWPIDPASNASNASDP